MSKILVVMPTRSRGDRFADILRQYVITIERSEDVHILVSYDDDDVTMTPDVIATCRRLYPNLTMVSGKSNNKIHACNRDILAFIGHWDVAILASDDMKPQHRGWDTMIAMEMVRHYPDYDGCLWFNDGHQDRICTMCIVGRPYLMRYGYFYHPSYISLWCDNEFTEVAIRNDKMKYYPHVLFFHDHPTWTNDPSKMDALYRLNEGYYRQDERNFERRKRAGFPIQ